MRINGLWYLCDDQMVRPVIRGDIQMEDGSWLQVPFLVDTGADCTVFSAEILEALNLEPIHTSDQLAGVGGTADSILVETQIRLTNDEGSKPLFKGRFSAFTDVNMIDMSILGRDILNIFSVIVDRQADTVCLLGHKHFYTIGIR